MTTQTAKTAIPNPQAPPPEAAEGRLPFMSHVKELRNRIMHSVIAIVITTSLAMIFGNKIIELLKLPARNIDLIAVTLLENMGVYFKVSLAAGVIAAMPVLVYELFAFVAPGLTSREKRMVLTILPAIVFMFLLGVAFAYFIVLPPALNFLSHFNVEAAPTTPTISNYINLVTRMLLVMGLVFETPLIIMALARMGVVSPQWLAARRRMWIVVAFVIAAIITLPRPITQTTVAVPLILLLELGIILARMVYKKKREPAATAAA